MSQEFDKLFKELAKLWADHEDLRMASPSIPALVESRTKLDCVRAEMRRSLAGLI